jgi:predicted flap endonuclease-1-like 5' DNA nuclease
MSNQLQVATPQPLSAFSSENAFVSVQRMAKALASSTLVPDSYRGEANLGNCIIALELSQRIGASVMAVMQSMVPIHGKPTWSASFLIATVNSCGRFSPMRFRWVGKEGTDDWGCRAYAVEREGNLELVGALVTIAMAKAEGWYGKSGSKWKTMPEQMLQYRAAAFWCRAYAPEIALGMHTSEEVNDTPAAQQVVQPSVVDVTPTPPEPKRRKKVEPEPAPVAVVEPTPEPAPTPEPEPTPAPVETPAAPEPAPAPLRSFDPVEQTAESTLAQIGITYAQLAKLATDLEWWPDADTYPTVADLPLEIQNWVIRNKRGIARAFQKAGGAL